MILAITGPLIVRKNPLEIPELPIHVELTETPITVRINSEIGASELLRALRIANKLFERFDMEGTLELEAGIVLLATGLGVYHKVEHLPVSGVAERCLPETTLEELANVAQDAGILHRMSAEIQALTNGGDLCNQKSEAIKREAAALNLVVQEYSSSVSVSRYLTITRPGMPETVKVRISDHGFGSGEVTILLRDSIKPAIDAMRATFANT